MDIIFSSIYISSDICYSKRKGGLYKYVLGDLQIDLREMLHIGGTFCNNLLKPKMLGIRAKRVLHNIQFSQNAEYEYNVGFDLFGPLLYDFCRWINSFEDNNTSLLFVSREGEFFKQCYDILYPENYSRIIYLSRKTVVCGTAYNILRHCSTEDFIRYIFVRNRESIGEVFRRINFGDDEISDLLQELGLKSTDPFDERVFDVIEKNRDILLNKLKPYSILFEEYITTQFSTENIIVDIGWKGSMQNLLEQYICLSNKKIRIQGLYLGIKDTNRKRGFLFEKNSKVCQDILCFSGLLEILTMPAHGSVIGYQKTDGTVTPVFEKVEFSPESLKIIQNLQLGVKDYLVKNMRVASVTDISRDTIRKRLIKFGCHPCREAIQCFGGMELYENGLSHHLIEDADIFDFKKIVNGFIDTRWKTGYLKKVFKIDFPYNIIISFLRKRMQKGE